MVNKIDKQQQQQQMKWVGENQVKAGDAGGIEAVVNSINTHIDSENICLRGCGALSRIALSNGKNANHTSS